MATTNSPNVTLFAPAKAAGVRYIGTATNTVYVSNAGGTADVAALDSAGAIALGWFSTGGVSRISGPYLGIVSSRSGVYSGYNPSGNWQAMSRCLHIAMDDITFVQLVWGAFTAPASTAVQDVPAGTYGQNVWTASIEYPVGTITPVTFGGANSGTCAGGNLLISDPAYVTIPRGTPFYVRCFHNSTYGNLDFLPTLNQATGVVPQTGEWCVNGTSGISDDTKSTINRNNGSAGAVNGAPNAVIGLTTRPTFYLAGDSRMGWGGTVDPIPNFYGHTGDIPRAIGKQFGIFNASKYGEAYSQIISGASPIAGYAKYRLLFAQFCSHVISGYGINDFWAYSATAAGVLANATALGNYFQALNKPFYQTTIYPKTTSTDSWATLGNQTVDPNNAARVTFNDALRIGYGQPFSGYIELANLLESSTDSGLWKVTGAANGVTSDGLHANAAGSIALIEYAPIFTALPYSL